MAFVMPWGKYHFKVMPFGLVGAPATFQRMMNDILAGLESYAAAYMDDVVIFSADWDEHLQHLKVVFGKLQESGLTVRRTKCQLGRMECTYLGHVMGQGKVKPEAVKVQAVQTFQRPRTKKEVRAFLGRAGY